MASCSSGLLFSSSVEEMLRVDVHLLERVTALDHCPLASRGLPGALSGAPLKLEDDLLLEILWLQELLETSGVS